MSVFLRWGVFGILGVAALLYAYNASKRMADAHAARTPVVTQIEPPAPPAPAEEAAPATPPAAPEPVQSAPPHCEHELLVAQKAIDMRRQGAPLDRVLRMQEVAWQEPAARRERLEQVASRWFNYEGDFAPQALRIAVISDCVQKSPAP